MRSQPRIRRFELYPIQEVHYNGYLDIKVVTDKNIEIASYENAKDIKKYKKKDVLIFQ